MSAAPGNAAGSAPHRDMLIVDDEQPILDLLTLALTHEVTSLDTAVDCASARILLAANRYTLLLTDVRLPDGSGFELVDEFVASGQGGHALVMSAFAETETEQESRRRGAEKFIAKPFRNLIGLGGEIRGLLGRDGLADRGTSRADCGSRG